MSEIIKTHDDDVIFSYESLKEFIRLIQRQGLNNLVVYSVSEILEDNKWQQIRTRDGKNIEFDQQELEDKKGYLVFVRYSYGWQDGWLDKQLLNGETISLTKNENSGRHMFVKTISDIIFYKTYINNSENIDTNNSSIFHETTDKKAKIEPSTILAENASYVEKNGTFVITIDSTQYVIKIKGFNDNGEYIGTVKHPNPNTDNNNGKATFLRGDGEWTNQFGGNFLPTENDVYDLGSSDLRWKYIYGTADRAKYDADGNEIAPNYCAGLSANADGATLILQLLNGKGESLGDAVSVSTQDTKNTAGSSNNSNKLFLVGAPSQSANGVVTYSNNKVYTQNEKLYATKVFNAVFNDYAECRKTIDLEPGRVVIDNDDGSLKCAEKRLLPGAQVISDTYGNLMGETNECKTPLAVAGRVLVYTYQPRENYHAGMAVCSAPNGTIDIMTRKEIKEYPDCIIGIVSEIPNYEKWGTDQVDVNGRIWIKVK